MKYSIAEAANLLGVSPLTLRAWLSEANITPERSPTDKRSWILTDEDVTRLAREHKRVAALPNTLIRGDEREVGTLPDLRRQLAMLEKKLEHQHNVSTMMQTVIQMLHEENKRQNDEIDELQRHMRPLIES